jgi:hypothetical protein
MEVNRDAVRAVLSKVQSGIHASTVQNIRSFSFGAVNKDGTADVAGTYPQSALGQVWSGTLLKDTKCAQAVAEYDMSKEHPVFVALPEGGMQAAIVSLDPLKHMLFIQVHSKYYCFDLGPSEGSLRLCAEYNEYVRTREWKLLRVRES